MKRITVCAAVLLLNTLLWGEATHTVEKGDTLFAISLRHEIPVEVLMDVNNLSDPSALRIGQTLDIPDTYEVRPGDTYYRIAQLYKTTVTELLAANERSVEDILLVGEKLLVPRKVSVTERNPSEERGAGEDNPPEEVPRQQDAENTYFWPHQGDRSPLTGKLKGAAFSGRPGDAVLSVSSGKVVWVAPYRGYNKLIIVEAPNEYLFAYGGNDAAFVSVGDPVFPGMEIGILGINPHYGSAKAFFFVYKDGEPVDPSRAPRT